MHRFRCVHWNETTRTGCDYEGDDYLEAEGHAKGNKRHAILDRLMDNIACVYTD